MNSNYLCSINRDVSFFWSHRTMISVSNIYMLDITKIEIMRILTRSRSDQMSEAILVIKQRFSMPGGTISKTK